MSDAQPTGAPPRRPSPMSQLRIWHLALLVLFVAIAIVNVQDQRIGEPALVGLAAGGFVLYGLLGWIGWLLLRRLESRLGMTLLLIVYAAAMAALFLLATVVYVLLDHVYRGGSLC